MKAYVDLPQSLSHAMTRVVMALKQYAPPSVEIVPTASQADLVFLHVIGMLGVREECEALTRAGKRYVVIQYCLRTAGGDLDFWLPLWRGADAVWTYYDLDAWAGQSLAELGVNVYTSPLGVESCFIETIGARRTTVMTTGYVASSESVEEVAKAVKRVDGHLLHLGPMLPEIMASEVSADAVTNISDKLLAYAYSCVQFISGLRRVEGFEMPAAEGVCCGARPILYDAPHYRRWFEGLAEFIPEGSPEEVTEHLVRLFSVGARPVTAQELQLARERFHWPTIIAGVWSATQQQQKDIP